MWAEGEGSGDVTVVFSSFKAPVHEGHCFQEIHRNCWPESLIPRFPDLYLKTYMLTRTRKHVNPSI